jgi:hypothetical protein
METNRLLTQDSRFFVSDSDSAQGERTDKDSAFWLRWIFKTAQEPGDGTGNHALWVKTANTVVHSRKLRDIAGRNLNLEQHRLARRNLNARSDHSMTRRNQFVRSKQTHSTGCLCWLNLSFKKSQTLTTSYNTACSGRSTQNYFEKHDYLRSLKQNTILGSGQSTQAISKCYLTNLTLFSIRFETGLLLQCHFFGTNADIGT